MIDFPRSPLIYLPTPVEELACLRRVLGGPDLLIKRDDMTGLAFGGNKSRKLEYLLAEAGNTGAKTLVTAGAAQSNHCRQTAAAAASAGLRCVLVLSGNPPQEASGNILLDLLLGAELVWTGDEPRDAVLEATFEDLHRRDAIPFLIPYGGSNPTGAAAYAYAIRELMQQGFDPDWIVFASSSGGTQAGLVAGTRLLGSRARVLGISVDEPAASLMEIVAPLASAVCALLGEDHSIQPGEILVDDRFLGEGYGVPGQAEKEAILLFARQEGILVDPVYTGRAAAGLIALIRQGFFGRDETVLFWHTGGTPALFADPYQDFLLRGG
jgi:D-cysteine desulfhydrase family pyridoxal phosphate-dependent enzyme